MSENTLNDNIIDDILREYSQKSENTEPASDETDVSIEKDDICTPVGSVEESMEFISERIDTINGHINNIYTKIDALGNAESLNSKLSALDSKLTALNDLFTRRLFEDKQKRELIDDLKSKANYAFIEPFLRDLIRVLDRLEQVNTETSESFFEEIYEILEERGVSMINVTSEFNRRENRAVEVVEDQDIDKITVVGMRRRGYKFGENVIRPADVIVHKPVVNENSNTEE